MRHKTSWLVIGLSGGARLHRTQSETPRSTPPGNFTKPLGFEDLAGLGKRSRGRAGLNGQYVLVNRNPRLHWIDAWVASEPLRPVGRPK